MPSGARTGLERVADFSVRLAVPSPWACQAERSPHLHSYKQDKAGLSSGFKHTVSMRWSSLTDGRVELMHTFSRMGGRPGQNGGYAAFSRGVAFIPGYQNRARFVQERRRVSGRKPAALQMSRRLDHFRLALV